LSFVAITLTFAWYGYLLKGTCQSLTSNSRKLHHKHTTCSEQPWVTMSQGEHTFSSDFSWIKRGTTSLDVCLHSHCPPRACTDQNWQNPHRQQRPV